MGRTLYRSYRSKSLDEIVGQDHITTTLKNALKNKAIAHAYLLSGPRGVGKTSVARIMAYAVNDLEYALEQTNLDIIEIDAASNRRIDEVREIRDKVRIAPTSGKYKVYIIDEVHMLTREAFNALLKTLEEPPEHAMFILATTEPHKLPDTIISRCIHFSFKAIEPETIAKHLTVVAKKEQIIISPEAINLLAKHSKGSFRDALSLLQQANYLSNDIVEKDVYTMLGLPPSETITSILDSLHSGDIKALSENLNSAYSFGTSPANIASELIDALRNDFINGDETKLNRQSLLDMQKDLLNVSSSNDANLKLEIILSSYALNASDETRSKKNKESMRKMSKPALTEANTSVQVKTIEKPPVSRKTISSTDEIPNEASGDSWDNFLKILKQRNNTLYGVMRMAKYKINGDEVSLVFKFKFHKKQIEDSKNLAIIHQTLETCFGKRMKLSSEVLSNNSKPAPDPNLQNLSNIFGGAEVLES